MWHIYAWAVISGLIALFSRPAYKVVLTEVVPPDRYAVLGLVSAAAVVVFAYLPIGLISMAPLAILGAPAFAQAVWNTSRIRELADPAYQARLQAITSMAFTLGSALGML